MFVFCLKNEQVKTFMSRLFSKGFMDGFTVIGVELFCVARFTTDGRINPDYLEEGEERSLCLWSELRPYIYSLIKGSKKPKYFKAVFALRPYQAEMLHENAASMHLTMSFENDVITFTAGTAQKTFSLSKEEDLAWENYLRKFFNKNGFICETPE